MRSLWEENNYYPSKETRAAIFKGYKIYEDMKKIMFNDRYGLTQAVLEGRKTNTRRIVPARIINYADTTCFLTFDKKPLSEEQKDYKCYETCDGDFIDIRDLAAYRVGEEVAIAQSYRDVFHIVDDNKRAIIDKINCNNKGWSNKMFVRAHLMPNRIRITNVRVERLQDISPEDCLKEGIVHHHARGDRDKEDYGFGDAFWFTTPRKAFAALIDKTCGRGTWDSNPWVFVYEFELIK